MSDSAEVNSSNKKSTKDKGLPDLEPVQYDKDFGKFSKHTTGFGLKMLQKFGFKGRLGKHETGRVNPIIPKVRSTKKGKGSRAGLNFKGIDSKDSNLDFANDEEKLKHKMKIDYETFDLKNEESGWRKGSARKRIKTSNEVIIDKKDTMNQDLYLYDYTKDVNGEKVEFSASLFGFTTDKVLFPELRFNLAKTVESIELKIIKNDRERNRISEEKTEVHARNSRAAFRLEGHNETRERLDSLLCLLQEIQAEVKDFDQEKTKWNTKDHLKKILSMFESLRIKYSADYNRLNLSLVLYNHVLTPLRHFVSTWDPSLKNEQLLFILNKLRYLLYDSVSSQDSTDSLYSKLCHRLITPKFKSYLLDNWNPFNTNRSMTSVFKDYENILSNGFFKELLDTVVSPKLVQMISMWDLDNRESNLIDYVRPWIDLFENETMDQVFEALFRKLALYMEYWSVYDEWRLFVFSQYVPLFPSRALAIVKTKIVPKLEFALAQTEVRPGTQRFELFDFIMKWQNLIVTCDLVRLFSEKFFPKWISVIHIWVSHPSPNKGVMFKDLRCWYNSWKLYFPPRLFSNDIFLENMFMALDLLNCSLLSYNIPPLEIVLGRLRENIKRHESDASYSNDSELKEFIAIYKGQENKAGESDAQNGERRTTGKGTNEKIKKIEKNPFLTKNKTPEESRKTDRKSSVGSYGFKDIVGVFAEENNVEFYPNPSGLHDGKQIYNFGNHLVYLDAQRVFAKKKGEWVAVLLQDLLSKDL